MHIDQIVIGATVGDAVTESAFHIRDALRRAVDSDLYALHVDQRLEHQVGRLDRYPMSRDRSATDVIIYHASIGDERVTDLLLHRDERLIVIYHNITPAGFFTRFDPEFAGYLEVGRRQLPPLIERACCVIADSEFNAAELRRLGRRDVHIAPPPINLARLLTVEPDASLVADFPRAAPGKMVLFVGQVLPHKRPDLIVAAHHLLVTNHLPDARLVIAGPIRNVRYTAAFRRFIMDLSLDTVWFTGELTDAQLAAFFRRADALVVASEHEGFCVPLIEAMYFDVPVVARGFGAIPDTVGGAALVLPPSADARHVAEAVRRVLEDEPLRHDLIERGRLRRTRFAVDRTLADLLRIVGDVVGSPLEKLA